MMRKLRAAWSFLRTQEWVDEPEWLDEDAESLRRFMLTGTGRKLALILRNQVLRQSVAATQSDKGLDRACGYANGFAGAVSVLDSLQPQHNDDFPTES